AEDGIRDRNVTGVQTCALPILKEAANTMKRVTLELGGKSPNIILPDADLTKAAPGVFSGIMANQGEVCSAGSRVYIQKKEFDHRSEERRVGKECRLSRGQYHDK